MNNYYQYNPYMGNQNPYLYGQNQPTYNQPQQTSFNQINGKVVDGYDVVKAFDVPIGCTYVFPKADQSEIFLKGWNNNGTTFIKEYKEIIQEQDETPALPVMDWNERFDEMYDRIDELSKKIDKIGKPATTSMKRKAGADE